MMDQLFDIAFSLVFLFLVFSPLERMFPAIKNQKIFRPNWFLDFSYFLGQYLIWGILMNYFLIYTSNLTSGILWPNLKEFISAQPFIIQVIEVVLFSDILIYWAHRFQHNNKFLWRFHKVHHSAEHLDWMAAHREHPLDTIYTVTVINLPAILMDFSLLTITGIITFRGIWAIYIHSNVKLNIGPLKYIIGSPEIHHWHHDRNPKVGNYANLSPLMDIIFGTFHLPKNQEPKFGINEKVPQNYVGQLLEPLIPKKKDS
jgi:sterol desaturase/sphingolipid hydroxylase (fatty acid hydroxylase superfamily)